MKRIIEYILQMLGVSKTSLEVKGVDTNITREEIVESVRESREDRY